MIPSVIPSSASTTSPTPPLPQTAATSQGATTAGVQASASQPAVGQAPSAPPIVQSSLLPAHNVAGFVFKVADTETGQVVVELPFHVDPDASLSEGSAKVDVRV